MALNSYHDQHHGFPPAYIADADGKPMHTWRVLILPYLGDPQLNRLYEQYDFSEPWNGPHNRKLAHQVPSFYRCRSADPSDSEPSYLAVVGPETAWPEAESMTIRRMTDGTSKTISLVDVGNAGFNWLEPRDLTIEELQQRMIDNRVKPENFLKHRDGTNFLFMDGSVHFLSDYIPPETLRALLTATGGEDVTIPDN